MEMTDNLLYQMMAACTSTQAPQAKPAEQPGAKRGEFDALMRKKQQEAGAANGQQTQKPDRGTADAAGALAGEENAVTEEQRALAAALAAQAVVIVPFQDTAATAEETVPSATVAAAAPVQAVTPAEEAPQQAHTGGGEQHAPVSEPVQNSVEAPKTAEAPVAENAGQKPETAEGVQQAQGETKAAEAEVRAERPAVRQEVHTVRRQDEPQTEIRSQAEPQPLFRQTEAVTVKVGQPEAPVRTEDGDLDSQMASRVKEALEQGEERVEIKLSPRSMGEVTVELTRGVDGSLRVALHTTTERGASLLSEHANGLSALLQNGAHGPVSVEVQRPQELQQPQQPQQQHGDQNWDGSQGEPRQQSQQQQQRQQESQDFLQQLRLGLVVPDEAVS